MYIVGFVFGLGFDTASEVGLLAITAVTSAKHSPYYAPFFALLFTCSMTLVDTLDGLVRMTSRMNIYRLRDETNSSF